MFKSKDIIIFLSRKTNSKRVTLALKKKDLHPGNYFDNQNKYGNVTNHIWIKGKRKFVDASLSKSDWVQYLCVVKLSWTHSRHTLLVLLLSYLNCIKQFDVNVFLSCIYNHTWFSNQLLRIKKAIIWALSSITTLINGHWRPIFVRTWIFKEQEVH